MERGIEGKTMPMAVQSPEHTYQAKLLQDRGDAAGDHAQVLPTHQHVGGSHEHGEGAQGMLRPQLVVAVVEVVIVQPAEMLLPTAIQRCIAAAVHQLYSLHAVIHPVDPLNFLDVHRSAAVNCGRKLHLQKCIAIAMQDNTCCYSSAAFLACQHLDRSASRA